jgi:hypothetical protein
MLSGDMWSHWSNFEGLVIWSYPALMVCLMVYFMENPKIKWMGTGDWPLFWETSKVATEYSKMLWCRFDHVLQKVSEHAVTLTAYEPLMITTAHSFDILAPSSLANNCLICTLCFGWWGVCVCCTLQLIAVELPAQSAVWPKIFPRSSWFQPSPESLHQLQPLWCIGASSTKADAVVGLVVPV